MAYHMSTGGQKAAKLLAESQCVLAHIELTKPTQYISCQVLVFFLFMFHYNCWAKRPLAIETLHSA